jgi:DNA-binding response OmpR family regulator
MTREKKANFNAATEKSAKSPSPEQTTRRILVVDDEASVRDILSRILAADDYEVLTASSGIEALEIAAANEIDLVLLDLNMPGQSGWETFRLLTTEHPLLPVIIITGCTNQVFTALGAGVGGLLEKPVSVAKLRQSVKALLAEPLDSRLARQAGRASEFYYKSSTCRKTE